MSKKVVITGIGLVTPLGVGNDENWNALMQGKSGIGDIVSFDPTECAVKIAGETNGFDPKEFVDKKDIKRYDKYIVYALAAAELAFQDSGLNTGEIDGERAGVIVGSGIGGFRTTEETAKAFLNGGYKKISPFFIPSSIINMGSGAVSIKYGLKGPNLSVVTACASGTHAIGDAAELIKRGAADIMVAGGAESAITPLAVGGFANMKALSRRNDDPTAASRPFDKDRDGFVMGEGAGLVILEEYESAKARGAKIYAEVAGYGLTADAYHMTAPDESGDGGARAMKMAVDTAGLTPADVDYINAHGTSTPYNDVIETRAIKKVFGEKAYDLKVSSTKSMTGHLLGAAGSVEAAFCAMMMEKGMIAPTINLDNADEECDLDYVPNKPVEQQVKVALSNSLGFGGTNATLLLKKDD